MIEKEGDWDWARHAQNQGVLRTLIDEAEKAQTKFIKAWLVHDATSLKAEFSASDIMKELAETVPVYERAIGEVAKQAERLKRMRKVFTAHARHVIFKFHVLQGSRPRFSREATPTNSNEIQRNPTPTKFNEILEMFVFLV